MSATTITTSNWVELADRADDGQEGRLYRRVKVTVTHLALPPFIRFRPSAQPDGPQQGKPAERTDHSSRA